MLVALPPQCPTTNSGQPSLPACHQRIGRSKPGLEMKALICWLLQRIRPSAPDKAST